ncbi:MAG: hypothetical protein P8178_18440, partial [Candidatus Thiodiazotropha sp.]
MPNQRLVRTQAFQHLLRVPPRGNREPVEADRAGAVHDRGAPLAQLFALIGLAGFLLVLALLIDLPRSGARK